MEVGAVFFFTFTDHTSPGLNSMALNFASLSLSLRDCLTFKLWSCSVFRLWLTFSKATLHFSGICTSARVPRVLFASDTVYVCARLSAKATRPCIGWKYVEKKGKKNAKRGVCAFMLLFLGYTLCLKPRFQRGALPQLTF